MMSDASLSRVAAAAFAGAALGGAACYALLSRAPSAPNTHEVAKHGAAACPTKAAVPEQKQQQQQHHHHQQQQQPALSQADPDVSVYLRKLSGASALPQEGSPGAANGSSSAPSSGGGSSFAEEPQKVVVLGMGNFGKSMYI
jgi:hypothetical protein